MDGLICPPCLTGAVDRTFNLTAYVHAALPALLHDVYDSDVEIILWMQSRRCAGQLSPPVFLAQQCWPLSAKHTAGSMLPCNTVGDLQRRFVREQRVR